MQMVILAGGLATRLGTLTQQVPKSLVEVAGRPFLHYQLELLRRYEVRDVVLCVGHLAAPIRARFGDGAAYGLRLRYSDEGEQRLGTAGALKLAEPLLDDAFMVMFGDSYLLLDYQAIAAAFPAERLGMMVVYRNENRHDSSDILVRDGLVECYDKTHPSTDMVFINEGLLLLRREALALLVPGRACSLQEFLQPIIAQRQLAAHETQQRFYEIGSFAGLDEFQRLVATGGLARPTGGKPT
jgi:NDP-sugar pyrophosphorylase family protein